MHWSEWKTGSFKTLQTEVMETTAFMLFRKLNKLSKELKVRLGLAHPWPRGPFPSPGTGPRFPGSSRARVGPPVFRPSWSSTPAVKTQQGWEGQEVPGQGCPGAASELSRSPAEKKPRESWEGPPCDAQWGRPGASRERRGSPIFATAGQVSIWATSWSCEKEPWARIGWGHPSAPTPRFRGKRWPLSAPPGESSPPPPSVF